jgi:hypothetical protein
MRAGSRRSGDAGGALVQIELVADQMDRDVAPIVRDGIAPAVDLDRAGGGQAAIVQCGEQGQQPALAGDGRAQVAGRQPLLRALEGGPCALQAVPGAVGCLVEALAREVIGGRRQAIQVAIPLDDALKQVGR